MKILRDLIERCGSSNLISKIKHLPDMALAELADSELTLCSFFDGLNQLNIVDDVAAGLYEQYRMFDSADGEIQVEIKPVMPISYINIDFEVNQGD